MNGSLPPPAILWFAFGLGMFVYAMRKIAPIVRRVRARRSTQAFLLPRQHRPPPWRR